MGDHRQSYTREASYCRRQATHFEGKPEKPFLLRLAYEFEELERHHVRARPSEHRR
jgi:hypothetical protein